ncbi:MAG: Ig-like domain-containing protein [Cyanobacteria bacterium P01_D01_bin.50]
MTNPNFAAPQTNPFDGINVGSFAIPTLVDIDGDGDLDAFVGNQNGNILYYKNEGTASIPNFTDAAATNPFDGIDVGASAAPTFADIDGDGDLDAFVGNNLGNILYYKNEGTASIPNFTDAAATNPFDGIDVGSYAAPTLADIDGDGDLDAFVGNINGNILYYKYEPAVANQAPSAVDDSVTTSEDTATSVNVLDNDSDSDGDTLTVTQVNGIVANVDTEITLDSGALLTLNADGTFDYNPNGVTESDSFTYTIEDDNGETNTATVTVTINEVNDPPTDISLDSTSIDENVDDASLIGNLSTTDPDTDDTFSYTLVEGFGDNDAFTIASNALIINDSPDFETKSSYSIRIKTTDSADNEFEKTFTINVSDVEEGIFINETEGGTNKLQGGRLGDTLSGNDGRDYINGKAGDDVLDGGEDNDRVYGGEENDTLEGGNGDDFLKAGTGNDSLDGGDGRDRLYGGGGDDTITGGAGNDFLRGDEGNDSLDGGAGRDRLFGGDGNDTLIGVDLTTFGVGEKDDLRGEAGTDTFVLGNGSRAFYHDDDSTTKGKSDYAYILDFETGDTIQLYGSAEDYTLDVYRRGISIYMNDDGAGDLIAKIKGVSLEDISSALIFVVEEA